VLTTEHIPIDTVKPHPRNVRQGDIGAITESLRQHGQYRPIVVQKSSGHILAGNHTWKAAKHLKWKQIAVTYVDVNDDEAMRILLVDNRANDLATYDDTALIELLQELHSTQEQLAGTGFNADDLDDLINKLEQPIHVPNFTPDETEQPRLDQRSPTLCPKCAFEWRVGPGGEIEPV
jgi:ParB-like chromosome segregation protein Spo0J